MATIKGSFGYPLLRMHEFHAWRAIQRIEFDWAGFGIQ